MRGYKNFDGTPHPGNLRHRIEIGYTQSTVNEIILHINDNQYFHHASPLLHQIRMLKACAIFTILQMQSFVNKSRTSYTTALIFRPCIGSMVILL